eukprot:GHVL01010711.1.p1 GENE.GHVL01010711.1~~GHVL01010711.1.p1  ORF type:complete len:870 (+),score=142.76 GHVL01010711.1:165-2774(+)
MMATQKPKLQQPRGDSRRSRSIGAGSRVRMSLPMAPPQQQLEALARECSVDSSLYGDKLCTFNRAKAVGQTICTCKAAKYMERQRAHLFEKENKIIEQRRTIDQLDEDVRNRESFVIEKESEMATRENDIHNRESTIDERESAVKSQRVQLDAERKKFESRLAEAQPKIDSLERKQTENDLREKELGRRENEVATTQRETSHAQQAIKLEREKLESRIQRLSVKEIDAEERLHNLSSQEARIAERDRTTRALQTQAEHEKRALVEQTKANRSDRATVERLMEVNSQMKQEVLNRERQLETKDHQIREIEENLVSREQKLNVAMTRLETEESRILVLQDQMDDKEELVRKHEELIERCQEMEQELEMRRCAIDAQEHAFGKKRMIREAEWGEMQAMNTTLQSELKNKETLLREKEKEIKKQQELLHRAQEEFNRLLPNHTLNTSITVSPVITNTTPSGSSRSTSNSKRGSKDSAPVVSSNIGLGGNVSHRSALGKYLQHMQYHSTPDESSKAECGSGTDSSSIPARLLATLGNTQNSNATAGSTRSTSRARGSQGPRSVALLGASTSRTRSCSPRKGMESALTGQPIEGICDARSSAFATSAARAQSGGEIGIEHITTTSTSINNWMSSDEVVANNNEAIQNLDQMAQASTNKKTIMENPNKTAQGTSVLQYDGNAELSMTDLSVLSNGCGDSVLQLSVMQDESFDQVTPCRPKHGGIGEFSTLTSGGLGLTTGIGASGSRPKNRTPISRQAVGAASKTPDESVTIKKNRRLSVMSPFDLSLSPSPAPNPPVSHTRGLQIASEREVGMRDIGPPKTTEPVKAVENVDPLGSSTASSHQSTTPKMRRKNTGNNDSMCAGSESPIYLPLALT